MNPAFELVVPCYDEARSLAALAGRAHAAAVEHGLSPADFRLVLVDNGSRDDSRAVLESLCADPRLGPFLRVVTVASNRGYGDGLWRGLQSTTAPVVGWTHADLQCDPGDALRALAALRAAAGGRVLVKGRRYGRSTAQVTVSRGLDALATVALGARFHEVNAQPKVFPRALLDACADPPSDFAFDLYMLYRARRAGYDVQAIDVAFPPRLHGTSHWARGIGGRARTMARMAGYVLRLLRTEGRVHRAPTPESRVSARWWG